MRKFQVLMHAIEMAARVEHSPSISHMPDKPLFGVSKTMDCVINASLVALTSVLVMVTVASAFIFPNWPPNALNIFFAGCITLMCMSHIMLIHWYHEGGLDPKFRVLIYYNTMLIVLFCSCANCFYHLL